MDVWDFCLPVLTVCAVGVSGAFIHVCAVWAKVHAPPEDVPCPKK